MLSEGFFLHLHGSPVLCFMYSHHLCEYAASSRCRRLAPIRLGSDGSDVSVRPSQLSARQRVGTGMVATFLTQLADL